MKAKSLLQLGLAFVLIYAGIDALRYPLDWVGFVPTWVRIFHVSRESFLMAHSIGEIVIGLWLLIDKAIRIAALLAFLDLLAIIVFSGFDRAVFTTTFRDVGLLFMALALIFVG